jgi:hypothetical protein
MKHIDKILNASIETLADLTNADKDTAVFIYGEYFDKLVERDLKQNNDLVFHQLEPYQIQALKLTGRYLRRFYYANSNNL